MSKSPQNNEITLKEKVLQLPLFTSDKWLKQKIDAVHCMFDADEKHDEKTASVKDVKTSRQSSQITSGLFVLDTESLSICLLLFLICIYYEK